MAAQPAKASLVQGLLGATRWSRAIVCVRGVLAGVLARFAEMPHLVNFVLSVGFRSSDQLAIDGNMGT